MDREAGGKRPAVVLICRQYVCSLLTKDSAPKWHICLCICECGESKRELHRRAQWHQMGERGRWPVSRYPPVPQP